MGGVEEGTRHGSVRRRRGRPPSLSTGAIAEAVLRVGFTSLTASAVAEELGVNHATLYRYVPNRTSLVVLAVQRLATQAPWPAPDPDWRRYLEANIWTNWQMFEDYPGLALEFREVAIGVPAIVERTNVICRHLVSLGFEAENALLACDIVGGLAAGSYREWERLDIPHENGTVRQRVCETLIPRVDPEFQVIFHRMLVSPREWFARKLAVALDGIAGRLAPGGVPDTGAR